MHLSHVTLKEPCKDIINITIDLSCAVHNKDYFPIIIIHIHTLIIMSLGKSFPVGVVHHNNSLFPHKIIKLFQCTNSYKTEDNINSTCLQTATLHIKALCISEFVSSHHLVCFVLKTSWSRGAVAFSWCLHRNSCVSEQVLMWCFQRFQIQLSAKFNINVKRKFEAELELKWIL